MYLINNSIFTCSASSPFLTWSVWLMSFAFRLLTGQKESQLLCRDRLSIRSAVSDRQVGDFSLSVSPAHHCQHGRCLLVHAHSNGVVDGALCGTLIAAYLSSSSLETLDHQQREFVVVCFCLLMHVANWEHSMYTVVQKTGPLQHVVITSPNKIIHQ